MYRVTSGSAGGGGTVVTRRDCRLQFASAQHESANGASTAGSTTSSLHCWQPSGRLQECFFSFFWQFILMHKYNSQ